MGGTISVSSATPPPFSRTLRVFWRSEIGFNSCASSLTFQVSCQQLTFNGRIRMSSRAVCCKRRLKLELDVNSSALIRVHLRLIFYQFKAQDSIIPPSSLDI